MPRRAACSTDESSRARWLEVRVVDGVGPEHVDGPVERDGVRDLARLQRRVGAGPAENENGAVLAEQRRHPSQL